MCVCIYPNKYNYWITITNYWQEYFPGFMLSRIYMHTAQYTMYNVHIYILFKYLKHIFGYRVPGVIC